MFRVLSLSAVAYFAAASAAALIPDTAAAEDNKRVEVTVTNITRGQIISPVLIASHTEDFVPLFELGETATDELAQVAEDANLGPLGKALSEDTEVHDVVTLTGNIVPGPILPGESASVMVEVKGKFRYISMVAMLVTTNDAFFALRGVPAPKKDSSVHRSPAYDSGSEANNEKCDYIPGPPCNNPEARAIGDAEGYVHIHAGVHGIVAPPNGLVPSMHDWRNPVAEIKMERMR